MSILVRPHYLRSLDQKLKGDKEPEYIVNDDETQVTLEHVLPENPGPGWEHIDQATADAFYRRLGNMVLLRASVNSKLGNAPFEEKQKVYTAISLS
jgi:hypothetical protein